MSEFHMINTGSGPSPPDVPTSFVTDVNSPAVPLANELDVLGGTTTTNNTNGVQTDGSSGGKILTVQLTNRLPGSASTVGLGTVNVLTFTPPLTRGIYDLTFYVAGWDDADTVGAVYQITGAIICNGIGFATTGTPVRIMTGDTTVFSAELVTVNVVGGSIVLQADGVAAKTIKWTALMNYNFGGA